MPAEAMPLGAGGLGGAAPLPRVLLVDDDASVRRLVALALDGQPLELLSCADGAEALALLQTTPVQVVISDLMMPGVSGLELLTRLACEPALRRGAQLVAFSAGIDATMRQRLQALGVQRMLAKPVSLQALEDGVLDAVAAALAGEAGQLPAGAPAVVPPGEPAEAEPGHAAPADEARAIQTHFGGDAALFHAFRLSCLPQFAQDLAEGEAAWAGHDAAALRRLAHSLKSVLATLGHAEAAGWARVVEQAAAAGNPAAAQAPWAALRAHLQGLAAAAEV